MVVLTAPTVKSVLHTAASFWSSTCMATRSCSREIPVWCRMITTVTNPYIPMIQAANTGIVSASCTFSSGPNFPAHSGRVNSCRSHRPLVSCSIAARTRKIAQRGATYHVKVQKAEHQHQLVQKGRPWNTSVQEHRNRLAEADENESWSC